MSFIQLPFALFNLTVTDDKFQMPCSQDWGVESYLITADYVAFFHFKHLKAAPIYLVMHVCTTNPFISLIALGCCPRKQS